MTQIKGFIAPERRAGALGVHSLDHFCLAVPDLEAARRFYGAFGLEVREAGNALDLYTAEQPHRWVNSWRGRANGWPASPSAPSTTISSACASA